MEAGGLNMKATELTLGLPGTGDNSDNSGSLRNNKRNFPINGENGSTSQRDSQDSSPPAKAQVVGWPPIRSFRKNSLQTKKIETTDNNGGNGSFVKVSMDGAPYLRKIDLNVYNGYPELLNALQDMFKFTIGQYTEREGYKGSDFAPTYEDKDGDWMLVGDVPWQMFISSCKRLRIMKGSEVGGLSCAV